MSQGRAGAVGFPPGPYDWRYQTPGEIDVKAAGRFCAAKKPDVASRHGTPDDRTRRPDDRTLSMPGRLKRSVTCRRRPGAIDRPRRRRDGAAATPVDGPVRGPVPGATLDSILGVGTNSTPVRRRRRPAYFSTPSAGKEQREVNTLASHDRGDFRRGLTARCVIGDVTAGRPRGAEVQRGRRAVTIVCATRPLAAEADARKTASSTPPLSDLPAAAQAVVAPYSARRGRRRGLRACRGEVAVPQAFAARCWPAVEAMRRRQRHIHMPAVVDWLLTTGSVVEVNHRSGRAGCRFR